MKYYLVIGLPYEGNVITEYSNLGPARRDYYNYAFKVKLDENGEVADNSELLGATLLEGKVVLGIGGM